MTLITLKHEIFAFYFFSQILFKLIIITGLTVGRSQLVTRFLEPQRHKSGAKVRFFRLIAKFFGNNLCLS